MSKRSNKIPPETYYDFLSEVPGWDILSNYEFLTQSRVYFVLNMIYLAVLIVLYTYVVIAGTYALCTPNNKTLKTQGFFQVCVLICSVGVRLSYRYARDKLLLASHMIRSGIFTYSDSIADEYTAIKVQRIRTLRSTVIFFTGGLFLTGVSNIVTPFLPLLLGKVIVNDKGCINPYLPLHICSPLDNHDPLEYAVEFFVYSVITVTMYGTFVSHEKLYISASLQITSELEILRYSLGNIARRALAKFQEANPSYPTPATLDSLFQYPEYQRTLYLCLRENILHYNAILRFKTLTYPYIERAVSSCIVFFAILMAVSIVALLEENRPELALVIDVFGFFPMCYVGQILFDESKETMYSLYDTPWPDCNLKFQTLLQLFMCFTLKPIVVKPRGIDVNMNLETHADKKSCCYEEAAMQEALDKLIHHRVTIAGNDIRINSNMHFTMIDGSVDNIQSGTNSTM